MARRGAQNFQLRTGPYVCSKGLELQLLCDSASHHLFASQNKFLAAYSLLILSDHHSLLPQAGPKTQSKGDVSQDVLVPSMEAQGEPGADKGLHSPYEWFHAQ